MKPAVSWALRLDGWCSGRQSLLVAALTVPVYMSLGSEFMPPLDEGTILYMPTSLPGMSVAQAQASLQLPTNPQQFPEVDRVFGKAGRAETSTDPAPLSMMETVISSKPPFAVAAESTRGTRLGAGMDKARLPSHHAGHRSRGRI